MDIEIIDRSRSLIGKIAEDIRKIDKCIDDPSMSIDSNGDLSKWETMIDSIGIQSYPRLCLPHRNVAEAFSQIWTGLEHHKGILKAVKERMPCKDVVGNLVSTMEDLLIQISLALKYHEVPPSPESNPLITSHLNDYQIRVTTHVTLVRLLHFREEVSRFLRTQLPLDVSD